MARFLDKVLADPITHDSFREMVKEAIVISGDNVAEYLFNVEGDRDFDVGRDFPNLAPPYETFWLDFKAPKKTREPHTGDVRDWPKDLPTEWGFYCRAAERRRGSWVDWENPEEVKRYLDSVNAQIDEITPLAASILGKFNRELAAKGSLTRLRLNDLYEHPWSELMESLDFNTMMRFRFLHHERDAIRERDYAWIERQYADVAQSRWILELHLFQNRGDRNRIANRMLPMTYEYLWTWQFYVNEDGTVPKANEGEQLKGNLGKYAFHYDPSEILRRSLENAARQNRDLNIPGILAEIERGIQPMLWCALMTITFLHAKGVTVKPVDQPDVPVKKAVARKIGSKTRKLVRFHTLEIEPLKQVLEVIGQANKTGIRQALATCRGHFKRYDEGKGLFGKYHGVYWWNPQLRGNKDLGMVLKEYDVREPQETTVS